MAQIDKDTYNQILARLVYKQKMAGRDQIQNCFREVRPDKDLGQVMVELGVLDFENYLKFHNYILKLAAAPNGKEKIRELLGSAAQSRPQSAGPREMPGRVHKPQPAPAPPQPAPVQQQAPAPAAPIQVSAQAEDVLPEEFRGDTGLGQLRVAIPQQLSESSSLHEMLLFARKHNASDIQIAPNTPIILKRHGKLKPVTKNNILQPQIQTILQNGLSADDMNRFMARGDLELAYAIPGGGRYRIALVRQRFGWEMNARVIPMKLRSFEESGLPDACRDLTRWAQGMVLVTGPLGCGKSSTLATLVEMINQSKPDHIISIEKPVEFVYTPARCQITQREVDYHTLSQANALRGALRQDPDIMVISELRDLETIRLAVSAAETGHLVFATMNTANATRTISRIIDSFPPDEQDVLRGMISETLRGVISQQLVPLKDGTGVVPAYEVLLVTKAISNLIRKNNLHQLASAMLTGRGAGMALLDESLKSLLSQGLISGEEAFSRATNQKTFKEFAPDALKDLINA